MNDNNFTNKKMNEDLSLITKDMIDRRMVSLFVGIRGVVTRLLLLLLLARPLIPLNGNWCHDEVQ